MEDEFTDEKSLIEATQLGDAEAFRSLVNIHQLAVRAFITSRLSDAIEAYDLTQEVFITAYQKLPDFDTSRPLRPWLLGISLNMVRRHHEKAVKSPDYAHDEILELVENQMQEGVDQWKELPVYEALQSCMEKLNDAGRRLMHSRYFEGREIREIREELGERHSTVTMKLHRTRLQLKECINRTLSHS